MKTLSLVIALLGETSFKPEPAAGLENTEIYKLGIEGVTYSFSGAAEWCCRGADPNVRYQT